MTADPATLDAAAADEAPTAVFSTFAPGTDDAARPRADLERVADIPLQLTVELGRTRLPIRSILQLAHGSIVELDTAAGEPLDILVNGMLVAQGEVVVIQDRFGIRLTDIVTPAERMQRVAGAMRGRGAS